MRNALEMQDAIRWFTSRLAIVIVTPVCVEVNMNIAVIHFHLGQGGVTHTALNHLRSLDAVVPTSDRWRVIVCHGGSRAAWPVDFARGLSHVEVTLCEISGLGYDGNEIIEPEDAKLASSIRAALADLECTAENTLLHVHNHSLGKNVSLPGALIELARDGFRLLLQIHDFAEDMRPLNYRRLVGALSRVSGSNISGILYPQAAHIHYAVLNRRDYTALQSAGVNASRLHLLPNPILEPAARANRNAARAKLAHRFGVSAEARYVLYPVRCIRRKNIGEALLWAALAPQPTTVGFTLPPLNPIEKPSYLRWRNLADELRLPCAFEVGGENGLDLPENLAACDCVLTTSLAEGFGMAFLEPNLARRPLVGRNLPEITGDFVEDGVLFPGLRPRLDVPLEWFDRPALFEMFSQSYNAMLSEYGGERSNQNDLQQSMEDKFGQGYSDFGDLDAAMQERVLRRVCNDGSSLQKLRTINLWIAEMTDKENPAQLSAAEQNVAAILQAYSIEVSGRRLYELYQSVAGSSRRLQLEGLVNHEAILRMFLIPSRFRPSRL